MNFKTTVILFFLLVINYFAFSQQKYVIVIHGGAGVMSKSAMSDERQAEYKEKLEEALYLGETMLKNGATSTETVVEVIKILEDSPLFNAGKGAVFTASGENELDASIMEGKNLNAGAIAGVKDIKNPIEAARAVMDKSEHVMLSGKGASKFARQQGLDMVKNNYFHTRP
ncbi:MAG TPA: beta-aspartyl-peptidase, partial [Mariniphaga anaerophila]|nr:beta-aspartyl-peptidase [Mariniphaga anaerophila]